MSDELTLNIAEYDRLLQITKEVDRLIQQAKSANFAADHLASFRVSIFDEITKLEDRIISSKTENDYEAVEQIQLLTYIIRRKCLDRHTEINVENRIPNALKTPKLLELAKNMAIVAQQL